MKNHLFVFFYANLYELLLNPLGYFLRRRIFADIHFLTMAILTKNEIPHTDTLAKHYSRQSTAHH